MKAWRIIVPVVLIVLGVIFLLFNLELVPAFGPLFTQGWPIIARWWPLILIAVGIFFLSRVR